MRPMLACDANLDKVRFPCMVQPKIDGVRALVQDGRLLARSLKPHRNKYAAKVFGRSELNGLDGEMAVANRPWTDPDLCRYTTSAISTIEGEPELIWYVFDYVAESVRTLPYSQRYKAMIRYVGQLKELGFDSISPVPCWYVYSREELETADTFFVENGFEGTIIRDPEGMHKQGRSTQREGGLLRIKKWEDAEAVVIDVEEGRHNANEPTINALGYTERSTHKENMIPNGMVGKLICKLPNCGSIISVSPGKLTEAERVHYWENKNAIIGQTIKFKFFRQGAKDKPRHPTFQTFRHPTDMGGE